MNKKRIILIVVLCLILVLFNVLDWFSYISIENLTKLSQEISNYGLLAPGIFIILYIVATVFFLPGIPLTLLSGLLFGPILGTLYVSIASTCGATFAFLIGRYIGRDYIVEKFKNQALFHKIDQGVKVNGWKMVVITRLVPLFPFNAQNYVYGLTDVSLLTYVFFSWLCMLPGTFAYVFLAGSIISGDNSGLTRLLYVSLAIALILILSVISKMIIARHNLKER